MFPCQQILDVFDSKNLIKELKNGEPLSGLTLLEASRRLKAIDDAVWGNPEILDVLLNVCSKLAQQGYLKEMGHGNGSFPYCKRYLGWSNDPDTPYGKPDFLIWGFKFIRAHFEPAMVHLDVCHSNGQLDAGSAFFLEDGTLITARHCIEGMSRLNSRQWDMTASPPDAIWVTDDGLDLAVLKRATHCCPRGFRLRRPFVLDSALALGFPSIPGLTEVYASEQVDIISRPKASIGEVVATGQHYMDKQDYLVINSRIKGGNSGGPIVGDDGKVIGVSVSLPTNDEGAFGYGLAIPGDVLISSLEEISDRSPRWRKLTFTINDDGTGLVTGK